MNRLKNVLVLLCCALSHLAVAQGVFTKPKSATTKKEAVPAARQESPKPAAVTATANQEPTPTLMDSVRKEGTDNLNKLDEDGKRHGTWWIEQPAQHGEDAYTTFGPYDHGQKTGKWYKINEHGEVLAIENYTFDVLNGEVKYFDRGRVTCIGNYRGFNPSREFDTVAVVDPVTGVEKLQAVPTEKGSLRHGLWRYYDMNTGALLREEEYQVDELIYKKDFSAPQMDSTAIKNQEAKMRYNKPEPYEAPAKKKQVSYIEFK